MQEAVAGQAEVKLAEVVSIRDQRRAPEIRRLSKRLFGSQYRVEVAAAIHKLDGEWTTQDLEEALPSRKILPWSCIAKEVASLVDLRLVERTTSKTSDGRIPYRCTSRFPGFWDLIEQVAHDCAGQQQIGIVTPIRASASDNESGSR